MTVHDLGLFPFANIQLAIGPRLTIKNIQAEVASYYGIRVSYMTSHHKAHDVSHPRQVAMFLCRELLHKSLPDIGNRFGGRDHTTVIHAIRAVKERLEDGGQDARDIRALWERLAPADELLVAA